MSEPGQINLEIGNEGKLSEWPSLDEYMRLKHKAIEEYKPFFRDAILKDNRLAGLSEGKIGDLSELFADFAFGVEMVYRRFGWPAKDLPFKLVYGSNVGPPLGVEHNSQTKTTKYLFRLDPILEELDFTGGITGRIYGESGGMKYPRLEDVFEFGGVEEGAHFLFFANKKHPPGAPKFSSNDMDTLVAYHTSDIERRALIWKIQYAKKYKQEYVADLEKLEEKASEIRLNRTQQ